MARGFVKDPSEVVALGDKVKVRVEEKDQQGRINLSMLFGDDTQQPGEEGGDQGDQSRLDRDQRPPRDQGYSREGGSAPRSGGYTSRPRTGGFERRDDSRRDDSNVHPLSRQLQRESRESGPKYAPKKRFSR